MLYMNCYPFGSPPTLLKKTLIGGEVNTPGPSYRRYKRIELRRNHIIWKPKWYQDCMKIALGCPRGVSKKQGVKRLSKVRNNGNGMPRPTCQCEQIMGASTVPN